MNFAVQSDQWVKNKESKNIDKYLDLAKINCETFRWYWYHTLWEPL